MEIWPTIVKLLEQPDKNVRVSIELSQLSPLPSDTMKISMVNEIDPLLFIENIAHNLLHQQLQLKTSTWISIEEIYNSSITDKDCKIFLEILLVVSKLSAEEYCTHYKLASGLSTQEYFEEFFLIKFLNDIKNRILKKDTVKGNERIMNEVKQFLLRGPVLIAYRNGLVKLGIDCETTEIIDCIVNMDILFAKAMGDISGITLRNGILICIMYADFFALNITTETLQNILCTSDAVRLKAYIITKCFHETAHYLARSLSDDYNFSSPKFCTERDPKHDSKLFEFGRYMELCIFGIQPDWIHSSEEAANDFINNALLGYSLPLIRQKSDNVHYLIKRNKPSLSFAGDMEITEILDLH